MRNDSIFVCVRERKRGGKYREGWKITWYHLRMV